MSNWKIYCDDHPSFHLQPQYKYKLFHIYFTLSHMLVLKVNNVPKELLSFFAKLSAKP